MGYRLKEDVHFCLSGGRVVLLDVGRNRYSCLNGPAESAFLSLCNGEMTDNRHGPALARLVQRGLLQEDSASPRPLVSPCVPTAAVRRTSLPVERPAPWLVARAIWALAATSFMVRIRSFPAIKRRVVQRRPAQRVAEMCSPKISYEQIMAAFARTSLLFHPADRCLPRSLAFASLCNGVGLYPDLVFGVRTNPFGAHCWVQADDSILYDESGEAALFTAILAI